MTEKETKELLAVIIGAYPDFLMGRSLGIVTKSWHRALKDSDFESAMRNVDNWIDQYNYPPTINYIKPWDGSYK